MSVCIFGQNLPTYSEDRDKTKRHVDRNKINISPGDIRTVQSSDEFCVSRPRTGTVPNTSKNLFDLILYVPSSIFQLNRGGSSWFEPVLS